MVYLWPTKAETQIMQQQMKLRNKENVGREEKLVHVSARLHLAGKTKEYCVST